MKKKFFTLLFICALFCTNLLHAQFLFEETFDYPANRALIADPVKNSDNFDGVTGWSTQSNSKAATNCFNIAASPLTYEGYELSGIGRGVKYNGKDGQGPFKLFPRGIKKDSTVYIAFMINIPSKMITGGDYIMGIKMEPSAASTNWGGRFFAAVDPFYKGEEVTFSINKSSGGTPTTVDPIKGPFFAADKTHLIVIKYKVGVLNGKSSAEEAGNYDDEMSLFVNPPLDGIEPATPLLKQIDPNQKDIFRYTDSGLVMGDARGIYLRSSAEGNIPPYTIGGIRVGLTWQDVIPLSASSKKVTQEKLSYYINDSKQIVINCSDTKYSDYELVTLLGQKISAGKFDNNPIDASNLSSGIYVLNLKDASQETSIKIIIK